MILFVKPNLFVISVIEKLETFKPNPEEGYMRVFLWVGLDNNSTRYWNIHV